MDNLPLRVNAKKIHPLMEDEGRELTESYDETVEMFPTMAEASASKQQNRILTDANTSSLVGLTFITGWMPLVPRHQNSISPTISSQPTSFLTKTKSTASSQKTVLATATMDVEPNTNEARDEGHAGSGGELTTITTLTTMTSNGVVMTHVYETISTLSPTSLSTFGSTTTILTTVASTGTAGGPHQTNTGRGAGGDGMSMSHNLPMSAIIGIAIGGTVVLMACIGATWYAICLRIKRKREKKERRLQQGHELVRPQSTVYPPPKTPEPDLEAYQSQQYSGYGSASTTLQNGTPDPYMGGVPPSTSTGSSSRMNPASQQQDPLLRYSTPQPDRFRPLSPQQQRIAVPPASFTPQPQLRTPDYGITYGPRNPLQGPDWIEDQRSRVLDPYTQSLVSYQIPMSLRAGFDASINWTDMPPEEYQELRQQQGFETARVLPDAGSDAFFDPRPAPLNVFERRGPAPVVGEDMSFQVGDDRSFDSSLVIPQTGPRDRSRPTSVQEPEEEGYAVSSGSEPPMVEEVGLRGRSNAAGGQEPEEGNEGDSRWRMAQMLMQGRRL
jgi:hypothetical protein